MIKAIIFDFFGVIRTDAYKSWLEKQGLEVTGPYLEIAQLQDGASITMDEFFVRLSKLAARPVDRAELDETATVDAGTLALIDRLGPTYRIGLLSNSPLGIVREIIKTAHIERYFDEIIISSEVKLIKPSPEIFKLTLKKLGAAPREAIFIDDNPGHVTAAAKLGIKSLLFTSPQALEADLRKAGITLKPAGN